MNLVLIPFLLAANVPVDQLDTWTHGPEFHFTTRIGYDMFDEVTEDPIEEFNTTSDMKCRPRTAESLICWFEENTNRTDDERHESRLIDCSFEIKFNKTGVESLSFEDSRDFAVQTTIFKILATMFNIGTDLNEYANELPTFVAKEQSILGECATLYTITTHGRSAENPRKFDLSMLPLPEQRRKDDIVIDKRIDLNRCTGNEYMLKQLDERGISIGRSTGRMEVTDTFRSQATVHMKLTKKRMNRKSVGRYVSSIELESIEPAKEELPRASFEFTTTIRFYDSMENNMIL